MTDTPAPAGGLGLYALKPALRDLLTPVLDACDRRGVSPDALSLAGVLAASGAALALAFLPTGRAALVVAPLLVARLGAANLDGTLARRRGEASRWGSVVNEASDRAADLLALAGCLALAPGGLVVTAMLAATLPSWVALAGAAAGADRIQGGPIGKTERAALLVVVAAVPGAAVPALVALAAGSALTAVRRLRRLRRVLRHAEQVG